MSETLENASAGTWVSSESAFVSGNTGMRADVYVKGAEDRFIAHIYCAGEEEALANAKLMAASKEMAKAMSAFLDAFDREHGHYVLEHETKERLRACRIAVRKAGAQ